ncbi:MAG: hypothetical protein FWF53_03655 [Candidatus Azobacteroides sp.]|nr:hypothetical protein [Candidatus Azobacteroides sp.]
MVTEATNVEISKERYNRIKGQKVGDRIIGTKFESVSEIYEENYKYQIIGEIVKWNADKSRVYVKAIQTYENDREKYVMREGNNVYISQNPHFWMDPYSDTDGWEWDV